MLKTKLRRTPLILLAIVLMLSVFSMTAFAEETLPQDDALLATDGVTADTSDADVADDAVSEGDDADVTADASDKSETGDAATDNGSTDATTGETTDAKKLGTSDIVSLIILAVVVIAVVVYCIVKREKVGAFFRSIKSEFKKIVWSPWNQVRKNTIVVIIVVVALAVVIGLADLLFMESIRALNVLF